ncbi:hypothetical protein F3N42_15040 [Marinihelvus fidelis]|uniref:DUF6998 domain-containing protein n=1 Tax=Marinihelvus fidelis TaxID=2613842 RepID=A0A5N0T4D0_9GAMM|nr:hypothetical protein F3N42_15040 [Marinihelvus fidelis]
MLNHGQFQTLVNQLYATVRELEAMFPGRHFTPDGHLVGSLGECLVADAYGLELLAASNKGFDAVTADGVEVEIKATQGRSVAFRHEPRHAIVIRILPDGAFEEVYNGPGALVWALFRGKPLPSNGQYQVSVARLRRLGEGVPECDRVPQVR